MSVAAEIWEGLRKARVAYAMGKTAFFYRRVFKRIGARSVIYRPVLIGNPRFISIGERVTIRQGARLEVVLDGVNEAPRLEIGSFTNIEQNVHFACHCRVVVGERVSVTANCAIVDVTHPYEDVGDRRGIGSRIDVADSFVEIGDDCFIGIGALILPNVRLGRHCVVGAHAVVTRSFPDYSVVAGAPARLVKQYRPETGDWVRADGVVERVA